MKAAVVCMWMYNCLIMNLSVEPTDKRNEKSFIRDYIDLQVRLYHNLYVRTITVGVTLHNPRRGSAKVISSLANRYVHPSRCTYRNLKREISMLDSY